ncbi:chromodomain-helicase-DNA-binding protein 1-like isoform X1 [Hemiscyllium ocellatum]|uniref:chromodomain-helicase-DNA-binding protein 1-like isoform X1 n=2 Tax=Hemiscyllium ocellatum TaxID=170820 RepID=UPI0029674A56|nr:chromodomain-helicase-DNA-binding protein 1-like isoform X1 [Hemiscyllium ocellatum]
MSHFVQNLRNLLSNQPEEFEQVEEEDVRRWGLTGISLRPYQLIGLNWLIRCYSIQHGSILADEMGLGKTCQSICFLLCLTGRQKEKGPFLILCPLSVLKNWTEELAGFAPRLSVVVYTGDKDTRLALQQDLKNCNFHVLLTTYEICLKDASFLSRSNWSVLIVDEAHRLKNQNSLLHKTLKSFSVRFTLLLTGTPAQNNLHELYSLLSFVEPKVFSGDEVEEFTKYYSNVEEDAVNAKELHSLMHPFLLRRIKANVAAELPKRMDIVLYHGMSVLQKKYYKAILMKDLDAFDNEMGKKTRLMNILIQLRKCVDHPYLFDGVEPEPFQIGDHLVEASGKLHLLDKLLAFLHSRGHRVLVFSQMARMLDILQDYMEYRGYSYERLDGSVRGEERYLAIKNFNQHDIFVFLLSTRAGGVGMNLTAADTVIFVDSDFNPQNDLQAAARAHRIGQKKPVKIIRLIGRDTVEELIYRRAMSKLKLTNTLIEGGQFSMKEGEELPATFDMQLSDILKFGLDKLLSTEESTIEDVDMENILGETRNGLWITKEQSVQTIEEEPKGTSHMYQYEGKDYSKEPSAADQKTFEQLLDLHKMVLEEASKGGRSLRTKSKVLLAAPLDLSIRKKRILSPEELEQRRQKRQEAAAKRAKLLSEKKQQREEEEHKKKMAWWESHGYRSSCLPSLSSESEDESEDDGNDLPGDLDSTDTEQTSIHYVLGDVTHPMAADKEDAIIVHCVDDSGRWGKGGLFTALEARSDEPRKHYGRAGKMKDLSLGSVLLFPIDDKESRNTGQDLLALIVAQQRDRSNNLSGIKLTALEEGLQKLYRAAKKRNASVHLPRIGHTTKGFNWYGTERLIRKYLSSRGISTYIYYFKRYCESASGSSVSADNISTKQDKANKSRTEGGASEQSAENSAILPDFMSGVSVYFFNISEKKRLSRYLITYNGDVDQNFCAETTHIVAQVDDSSQMQELQSYLQENPTAVVVQARWLEVCFSKQQKVDTFLYEIKLTNSE